MHDAAELPDLCMDLNDKQMGAILAVSYFLVENNVDEDTLMR